MGISPFVGPQKKNWIFLLAGIVVLWMLMQLKECRRRAGESDRDVLLAAIADYNRGLPLRIDSLTTFDSLGLAGERLLEHYFTVVVHERDSVMHRQFRSTILQDMADHIKSIDDLGIFRERRFAFGYTYYDTAGVVFYRVEVTPQMYMDPEE